MVRVVRAKHSDVDEIVPFGYKFWQQTDYYQKHYVKFNMDHTHKLIHDLIDNGIVQIVRDEERLVGMILFVVGVIPFNPDFRLASEVGFYVDPNYRGHGVGIKLLKQAENVARQQGIRIVNMISMESVDPATAEKLYKSLKYRKNETVWTKEL